MMPLPRSRGADWLSSFDVCVAEQLAMYLVRTGLARQFEASISALAPVSVSDSYHALPHFHVRYQLRSSLPSPAYILVFIYSAVHCMLMADLLGEAADLPLGASLF